MKTKNLSYSTTNANSDDGTVRNTRSFYEHHYTLGATLDNFLFFSTLDFSFDLTLATLNYEYKETRIGFQNTADNKLVSTGTPGLSFLLRPIFKISDNSMLICLASVNYVDASSKFESYVDMNNDGFITNHASDIYKNTIYEDKTTSFAGLFAFHTQPTEKLKIIYSVGCTYKSRNQKNTGSTWATNDYEASLNTIAFQVPAGVSLEYEIVPEVKSRFGVTKFLVDRRTTDGIDREFRSTFSPHSATYERKIYSLSPQDALSFSLTAGLGFKIKDFDIDLVLLTSTYNFNNLFSGASIKYHY